MTDSVDRRAASPAAERRAAGLPRISRPATPEPPTGRAWAGRLAAWGAPAPGAIELASLLLGAVTMVGIVLAGYSHATGRPPAGGVAISVETPPDAGGGAADGGDAGVSPLRIRVTNEGGATFTGRLVVRGGEGEDAAEITVEPGAHEVVAIETGAGCGERVTVALESGDAAGAGGAAVASLVVPAPCAPGATP